MVDIIKSITTPLALSALAVLVFFGFYQIKRKRQNEEINFYSFIIVLVFGILGTLTYILKEVIFTDVLIRGEVRLNDGRPLQNATVDLVGVGRAPTNELGSFELSVPYSRQKSLYSAYIFSNGLRTTPISVNGPRPEFVSLKFNADINVLNYIDIREEFFISQNIGDPLFTFGFRTKTQIDGRIKIQVYQVKFIRPDKVESTFFPVTGAKNGAVGFLGDIILDRDNQGSEYSFMNSPDSLRFIQQLNMISAAHGPTWLSKCGTSPLDTTISAKIQSFFDSLFFWIPGDYQITIRLRVEDSIPDYTLFFNISQTESDRLNKMRSKIPYCRGLAVDASQLNLLNYYDSEASNTLLKAARKNK